MFNKDQTTLIQYPAGKTNTVYAIPGSVTSIGRAAFVFCTHLAIVNIPEGMTAIGAFAFAACFSLTTVSIPNSVTAIDEFGFDSCTNLVELTIPNSVTTIGSSALSTCLSLTNVTIGNRVTDIGHYAFYGCSSLQTITFPRSVAAIRMWAFGHCTSLTAVYFRGNAPSLDSWPFYGCYPTLYYLPGTTGWSSYFGGRPTAPWHLPKPLILDFHSTFGVLSNRFGFTVSWATNASVIIDATENLASPTWTPAATNSLTGDGWFYFSDPDWTAHPNRFYRLRTP